MLKTWDEPDRKIYARSIGRAAKQRFYVATDYFRALSTAKPSNWEQMTFSQKLQWRCCYPDPKVDYTAWADKAKTKGIVADYFLFPETYAFVRDPEEIVELRLPPTFVMKATHGWNKSLLVENGIVQGTNRSARDIGRRSDSPFLRDVAASWMRSERERWRRAWERHYRHVDCGVLFEAYIQPVEYEIQLLLFSGRYRMALVFFRPFVFKNVAYQIYDEDWTLREPVVMQCNPRFASGVEVPRPPASLFQKLERLCQHIDHVRADFIVSAGQYYLLEFTFTHNAGHAGLLKDFDAELGGYWIG